MTRSFLLLTIGAVGAAGMMIAGAGAQVMQNHDSNAPVNFNADRIEVQDRADRRSTVDRWSVSRRRSANLGKAAGDRRCF